MTVLFRCRKSTRTNTVGAISWFATRWPPWLSHVLPLLSTGLTMHLFYVCECFSCKATSRNARCPQCAHCNTEAEEPCYLEDKNTKGQPSSSGKRKQSEAQLSPMKRIKTASVTPSVIAAVNLAAIGAVATQHDGPEGFCLISHAFTSADCRETCHVVQRALSEDEVICNLDLSTRRADINIASYRSSSLHGAFHSVGSILTPATV
jgi:hypothetical protein